MKRLLLLLLFAISLVGNAQNTFQPKNLIAVAGNGMVTISFETEFTADPMTYEVQNLSTSTISTATRNPIHIWNLVNGSSYQFRIRSVINSQYSDWSESTISVSPSAAIQTHIDALKDVALEVATERRDKAINEGRTADADQMTNEIAQMQTAMYPVPSEPYFGPGFFPKPSVSGSNNKFLVSFNEYANSLISLGPDNSIGSDDREGGNNVYSMLVSPYSNNKYNPVLFKMLLNYIYNSIERNNGNPLSIVNTEQSFGSYILPFYRNKIITLINTIGSTESNVLTWEHGFFANLDVIRIMHTYTCAKYLKNQSMWDIMTYTKANLLGNMAGDGAYPYIGNQNSHGTYHGATQWFLLHCYAIMGDEQIFQKLIKTQNYEIITAEGMFVNDAKYGDIYITVGWKKNQYGFNKTGSWLTHISGSPYQRYYNGDASNSNALAFPFFNPNLSPTKPLPNNYLIYDRNILGPKRRKNNFSFGITGRTGGFPRDIALSSHVGAMNLDGGVTSVYNVSARIDGGADMIGAVQGPKINMSKLIAGFSAKSKVYYYRGGPAGGVTNWSQFQQWVALSDRLVGYVELSAPIPLTANQNEIWVWLARSGAPIQTLIANKEFNYNSIKIIVHETDFENVEVVSNGLSIRNNNQYGASTTYPAGYKKFAIVEIRETNNPVNIEVTKYFNNNVYGLNIKQGSFNYSVWRNYNATNATVNLSNYINASIPVTKHLTRTESAIPAVENFTGNTLTLAPDEQVLLVNSNRPLEISKAWDNFDVLLEKLPKINIWRTTTSDTFGQIQTFQSFIDNANNNSMYQWKINGIPVPGANGTSFSTKSLVSGQHVTCELSTPLEDGTFYTVESNLAAVSLTLAPNNCSQGVPEAFLIPGATKLCLGISTKMSVRIVNSLGPYTVVYFNGQNNETISGYSSGDPIVITPGSSTSTYSLVRIISESTGCEGTVDTTPYVVTIDTGTQNSANYLGTTQTTNHESFVQSQKFSDNGSCANQYVKVQPAAACPAQVVHQGSTYTTQYLNGQCWIKENIKATPSQLPVAGSWQNNVDTMWHGTPSGSSSTYYYQWSAAMNGSTQERSQGVCPTGFHIPSDCEWMFFEHNLGLEVQAQQEWDIRGGCSLHGYVAKKLLTPALSGSTSTGTVGSFTGFRGLSGNYTNTSNSYYVWTSSQINGLAINRFIQNNANGIGRQTTPKGTAMQVRCIKD